MDIKMKNFKVGDIVSVNEKGKRRFTTITFNSNGSVSGEVGNLYLVDFENVSHLSMNNESGRWEATFKADELEVVE